MHQKLGLVRGQLLVATDRCAEFQTVPLPVAFVDALYTQDLDQAQRILLSQASRGGRVPAFVVRACSASTDVAVALARRAALREAAVTLLCEENNVERQFLAVQPAPRALVPVLRCLSTISVLPVELLDEIFKFASLYGAMQTLCISHVCSRWRELVCSGSVPGLWSIIVSDRTDPRLLDLFFQRAGNHPVSLAVASSRSALGEVLLRKPALAHQIDRIVLWRFPTSWGTTPPDLGPLSKAPVFGKAEELTIILPSHVRVPVGTLLFGMREGGRFPSLRSLELDRLVPINMTSNLISDGNHLGVSLQKLSLSNAGLTSRALHTTLYHCSKLTSLTLRDCHWSDKELESEGDPYSVTLPLLHTLNLSHCDVDFCFFVVYMLKAPALQKLYLNPSALSRLPYEPSPGVCGITIHHLCCMLKHFLGRSRSIEHLTLIGVAALLEPLVKEIQRAVQRRPPLLTELRHLSILFDPLDDANTLHCIEPLTLRRASESLWNCVATRQRAAVVTCSEERCDQCSAYTHYSADIEVPTDSRRVCHLREVGVTTEFLECKGTDVDQKMSSLGDRFGLTVHRLSFNAFSY